MDTRENQQDKGSQKLDPLKNVNLPDGESIEEVDDAAMLNDLLRDLSPDLLVTDEEKTAGEPAAVDAPSDVVSAETLVTDEKEAEVSPEVVEAAPVMAPEPEPVSEPEEVVSVPPVETVEKDSPADLEPPEDLQVPSESAVSGGWDVADEPAELELAMDQAFGLDAAEPLSPTLSSTETPAPLVDEPVEESAVDLEPAAPAVPSLGGSSSSGDELDGVFDAFEMAEEDVESEPVAEAESAPESSAVDEVLDGVFGTSGESEVPTESVDVEQSALDTELDALFGETSEPEGVAAEEPAKQTSDDETMLTPLDHIEPEPAEGLPEEPVSEPEQKIVEQKTGGVGLFDEMSLDESLGEALGLGPGDGVKETKQEPVAEAIPAEEIVPQTIFADVSESEKPVDGAVGPPDSGLLDLVTGLVVERMVTRIEQDQTYDESATPAPVAPVAEPPVDIPLETPVEADATTDELDEPPAEAGFLDATIEDEFVVAEEEPVTDQATTPEIVRDRKSVV